MRGKIFFHALTIWRVRVRNSGSSANLMSCRINRMVPCDLAGPLVLFLMNLDAACRAALRRDRLPEAHGLAVRGSSNSDPGCWHRLSFRVLAVALVGIAGVLLGFRLLGGDELTAMRSRAEAAAQVGDWTTALELCRKINASGGATSSTHLARAERAWRLVGPPRPKPRSARRLPLHPRSPTAWLLLLEVLRVEDRLIDAFTLGWKALDHVLPADHPQILRELTLAALTDLPDEYARKTLRRWIDADAGDVDARVALLRRMGADPRADDPQRESRLAQLRELLAAHPGPHRCPRGACNRTGRCRRNGRRRPATGSLADRSA